MKKCLVFLPGIMGSELREPNENKKVWPPKGLQLITGYDDVNKLLNPNLIATRAIRNVFVIAVYSPLLEDFEKCGYIPDGQSRELIEFAYDWRLSNQITAKKLAERLDEIQEEVEIKLVGHSMGGLILRYLLESGEFEGRHWFKWINGLITLGTPHKGAPEALRQVLGLEEKAKLDPAQIKKLASDERYPSAYQLTPTPDSSFTLSIGLKGELPKSIETFSSEVMNLDIAEFSQSNIDAATTFWKKLNLKNKPAHVDYFFFGGANHKTFSSNEIQGNSLGTPKVRNSGDGTVPITSSIVWDIPHGFSAKNHGKIFTDRNLRLDLFKMLDAPEGVKPFSAHGGEVDVSNEENRIGLSLDKDNYDIGEEIELSISYTQPKENPMESFSIAKVDIQSIGEKQVIYEDDEYRSFNIQFNKVNVRDAVFTLDLELDEGYYELIPRSQTDDPTPTFFTIKGNK